MLLAHSARKFTSSASLLPLHSFISSLVTLKQLHPSTDRTLHFALLLRLVLYHLHFLLPKCSDQLLIGLNLLHQTLLQRGLLHQQHLLKYLDLFPEAIIIQFHLFIHFIDGNDVFHNILFFLCLFVNFVQHLQYCLSLAIYCFLEIGYFGLLESLEMFVLFNLFFVLAELLLEGAQVFYSL